jgi:hypothetical protein
MGKLKGMTYLKYVGTDRRILPKEWAEEQNANVGYEVNWLQ